MSVECRYTPRASAWILWIHSLSCDAADCDAERNSYQFSISELLKQGFSNSPQQVCEKEGVRKHFPACARIPAWPLQSCGHRSLPEVPPSLVALPQPGGEIRAGSLEMQRLRRSQSGASLFQ